MPPKKREGKKGKKGRGAGKGGGGRGAAGDGGGGAEEKSDVRGDLARDLANLSVAAAAGQPDVARVCALGALRALSRDTENRVRMWQHVEGRAVLVGSAAADQPENVRVEALAALRNLTCAAENHRCRCCNMPKSGPRSWAVPR